VLKFMECCQQGGIVGVKAREVPVIINIKKRAHSFKNVLKKKQDTACTVVGSVWCVCVYIYIYIYIPKCVVGSKMQEVRVCVA
jgi:hypothetical protein